MEAGLCQGSGQLQQLGPAPLAPGLLMQLQGRLALQGPDLLSDMI